MGVYKNEIRYSNPIMFRLFKPSKPLYIIRWASLLVKMLSNWVVKKSVQKCELFQKYPTFSPFCVALRSVERGRIIAVMQNVNVYSI